MVRGVSIPNVTVDRDRIVAVHRAVDWSVVIVLAGAAARYAPHDPAELWASVHFAMVAGGTVALLMAVARYAISSRLPSPTRFVAQWVGAVTGALMALWLMAAGADAQMVWAYGLTALLLARASRMWHLNRVGSVLT